MNTEDKMAPARGIFHGIVLGSIVWIGILLLVVYL